MSQIDEIKSRIDIVDLVSETVKLRRTGKNFSGLCPFHNEKTPSFIVSPDRQTWRCFGQCGEGGDIFKFVMKKEGWDFKEALRYLAERAGVKLEAFSPQKQEEKEEHDRLRTLLEEALAFYRHQLLNTPAGKPALDYIHEKRHLSDATIETFGMGYAPQGWDNALKYFKEKGYAEQELVEAGLATLRDNGGYNDKFRNRLMIPIRDENGKMTGFGARILDPKDFPKFMNSPETPLFSKSRLLYGLDRARKPIRAADQAVIVEGYLDVIALHQAGFENVVSPMGTSLTEEQLRLLKKFTRRIVLALDPDAAGQKAVLRGLEAARQTLDRQDEIGFDARGLLHHEARLQADLRVASMPDELDPDEIVQRDPEQWKQLIETAQPIVVHVMNALAAGRDLEDAKVKTEIVSQVLPLIEDLPNPVERDTYRQRLARFLKVDERSISGSQAHGPSARRPRPRPEIPTVVRDVTPPVTAPSLSPSHKIEAHVLGILVSRPDLLYRLDRALMEAALNRMTPEDFGYTDHQVLFRLIRQSLEQDTLDVDQYLVQNLPSALESLVGELAAKVGKLDPLDDRLIEDMFRAVVKIRRTALNESINELRFLQEDAQQTGDLRAASYRDMVQQYSTIMRSLDQAQLKQNGHRQEGR
ncbi:MAG TPA: DNA primase [Anaerolineales bacterium]|nr:DNA primase [Anaerolineales bacterium]